MPALLSLLSILKVLNIVNTKNTSYPFDMAGGDKMINIGIAPELLEEIDTFRFQNRFATRVEAMRWLMKAALDKKLKPAKPAVPKGE